MSKLYWFIKFIEYLAFFSFQRPENRQRTIAVDGITTALWYFITRGHHTIALLPQCYRFDDNTDRVDQLMQLHQLGLVELTCNSGRNKHDQMHIELAMRELQYGGCIVAKSQYRETIEIHPQLSEPVEHRY
jgi:hypothetical protein